MRDTTAEEKMNLDERYVPLRLGSNVVGWAPNVTRLIEDKEVGRSAMLLVGDKLHRTRLSALQRSDSAAFRAYSGEVILNLPVDSVDIDESGLIDYSKERSAEATFTAATNYFRLLQSFIQSEFHKKTPAEALTLLTALMYHNYPTAWIEQLSWRGDKLNSLVSKKWVAFFRQSANKRFDAELKFVHDETRTFRDFLDLQTRWVSRKEGYGAVRTFTPENVFIVVTSAEDQLIGEMLFEEFYLNAFLQETGHKINSLHDRTFFFCEENHPLVDWVAGTKIPLTHLHEVVSKLGIF